MRATILHITCVTKQTIPNPNDRLHAKRFLRLLQTGDGGSQKQRLISHCQEQRCCYPHVINTSANSRCEHEDGEQLLGSGRARSEVQWRGADGRRVWESVTDKTNTEKKVGMARMPNTPCYSTVLNVFQNNQNTQRQSRENEKLRLKEDHF